jgi:hypothetical protein
MAVSCRAVRLLSTGSTSCDSSGTDSETRALRRSELVPLISRPVGTVDNGHAGRYHNAMGQCRIRKGHLGRKGMRHVMTYLRVGVVEVELRPRHQLGGREPRARRATRRGERGEGRRGGDRACACACVRVRGRVYTHAIYEPRRGTAIRHHDEP